MEYAVDRKSFIENVEYKEYQVTWTDTRRHVTFICPNGRKYRDSSLHDETFLKENLDALFTYRQKMNVYSLRHSNASLLIANGADVATVAGLLGHSQPSTTLDIYNHAFDRNKKVAGEALQRGLYI